MRVEATLLNPTDTARCAFILNMTSGAGARVLANDSTAVAGFMMYNHTLALVLQKKRRVSDCRNHKKQLIPRHHNSTTLSIAYLMEVFTTLS